MRKNINYCNTTSFIKKRNGLSALQHYDIVQYMEGDILTKVDRASMAVSLETRPPFLDHKFMETCFKFTDTLKLKGKTGKWILKQAFKNELPKKIISRKKMGFAVPIQHYFENELIVRYYLGNYEDFLFLLLWFHNNSNCSHKP